MIYKKRVLIVSHSAEYIGGSEKSILKLAQRLLSENYEVIFCLPGSGSFKDKLIDENIEYTIIPFSWSVQQTKKNLSTIEFIKKNRSIADMNLHAINKIASYIENQNIKCVITNTSTVPWGAYASKISGIPHCWFIREYGKEDFGLDFGIDLRSRASMIDKFSDIVLFNSVALKQHFSNHISESKIRVIYPSFKVPEQKRSKRNIRELLLVGSISPGKGQLEAVKAVHKLSIGGNKKVSLRIIGMVSSPEYLAKIKNYIKKYGITEQIKFEGFKKNTKEIYEKGGLLVSCSEKEAFGRSIPEAMLRNIPVIVADTGGMAGLINDGINGFKYKAGSAHNLAAKINEVIEMKPEKLSIISRNAQKFAKENFTTKPEVEFVRTINDLIAKSKPCPWLKYIGNTISPALIHYDNLSKTNKQLMKDVSTLREEATKMEEELNQINSTKIWKIAKKIKKIRRT